MWHVYLLTCSDNTIYSGITNNLFKRISTHNSGKGAKYTRSRLPVKLFKYSIIDSKSNALKIEYKVKQLTKQQKINLQIIDNYEFILFIGKL